MPNHTSYTEDQIREYILDRRGVEEVITGAEARERGIDEDSRDDEWHAYGVMPNTNEPGWYLVAYTFAVVHEMREMRSTPCNRALLAKARGEAAATVVEHSGARAQNVAKEP